MFNKKTPEPFETNQPIPREEPLAASGPRWTCKSCGAPNDAAASCAYCGSPGPAQPNPAGSLGGIIDSAMSLAHSAANIRNTVTVNGRNTVTVNGRNIDPSSPEGQKLLQDMNDKMAKAFGKFNK